MVGLRSNPSLDSSTRNPLKNRALRYTSLVLLIMLTGVALLATVLPWLPSKQWYVRIFDYPRLQTFFMGILALVLYAVVYFKRNSTNYLFLVLLVGIIGIQGYKAFPYTLLGTQQVKWSEQGPADTTSVSLFICNVLQTNTAYDQVVARINEYDPDLIITTETDSNWQKGLSEIESRYPNRIAIPLPNTYGMHLYSRLPLDNAQVRYLLEPDIPSIRTRVQLRSGEWVHLFILHPRPPVPGEETDSKERDAEIIMVGREARKETDGVIVAGDFNDVAWSETTELFQEISGFLDPRRGRGFYSTFHAKYPIFRWPLDHLFHSSHFKLLNLERAEKVNSDHFPMYVKLSYEPKEVREQPKVKKEASTEKKANEAIHEGKVDAK